VRAGDSYGLVLVLLLLALFAGVAAPQELWTRVIRDAIFAIAVMVAYWTATPVRSFLGVRVLVPALALAIVVVGAAESADERLAAGALAALVAAIVIFLVARDLFVRRRVDLQTVLGALSLYVLIGFFFASMFTVTADAGSGPFFSRGDDGTPADHLYFSLVTLTTTGYGDLAAVEGVGRAFAVFEVVLGELYLVTVIAILVAVAVRRQWVRPEDG
jgi:hypothetical protein